MKTFVVSVNVRTDYHHDYGKDPDSYDVVVQAAERSEAEAKAIASFPKNHDVDAKSCVEVDLSKHTLTFLSKESLQ